MNGEAMIGLVVLVACPRCGKEISRVIKEWDFRVFHVKNYYCDKCDKKFNEYYRNGNPRFTIPKRKE